MGDLERFRDAHRRDFAQAYAEIQNGYKETHWMWYIFPQIQGLGRSSTAQYYAVSDIEEAVEFLSDPYLGDNLRAITKELLSKSTNDAEDIFGYIDAMKLKSSMTLFALTSEDYTIFDEVLEHFFGGEMDEVTVKLING